MPTTAVDLLRRQAENAFQELTEALEGIGQGRAWARIAAPAGRTGDDEYLHTDGSIQSVVLHLATGKFMYGSIGFRKTEHRWREMADRLDAFEPDWTRARGFLDEAHAYWMQSWAFLEDANLDEERPRFDSKWPTWKILTTLSHHDSYHAGQIAVLRFALGESQTPPPSYAEDIRLYCREMGAW